MEITIDDNRTFFDIEQEFKRMFPFLKIEFFTNNNKAPEDSLTSNLIKNKSNRLAECRKSPGKGIITITPLMTVYNLNKFFNNEYGLSIKVFRNSWLVWLEATVTDGWTLEEQNRQGEALSRKNIQNTL